MANCLRYAWLRQMDRLGGSANTLVVRDRFEDAKLLQ
jgi:hypothetical protein